MSMRVRDIQLDPGGLPSGTQLAHAMEFLIQKRSSLQSSNPRSSWAGYIKVLRIFSTTKLSYSALSRGAQLSEQRVALSVDARVGVQHSLAILCDIRAVMQIATST